LIRGTARYELRDDDWLRVGGENKLTDLLSQELTQAIGKEFRVRKDLD
jgi:frataxin-like iron-binding protein CyaY